MGTTPPPLVASATSGLVVSLASLTPAVCTVNAYTLSLVAAGSCTLTASQPGNSSYAAAAMVKRTFTVAAAPAVASATLGKSVYATSCAMCHTANPVLNVSKVLKGANSPSTILNAIRNNIGGMSFLSGTISTQDANNLAAYLATPSI
jgi:mono/diheme cytochrome c family protein